MSNQKFNLSAYTQEVLQIAEKNNISIEEAMHRFLANLAVMSEHYKGASNLNYHELGQKWNKLLNQEKIEQKAEFKARLSKYNKRGNV